MECLKNLPTRNPASFMSSAAGDNSLMQKIEQSPSVISSQDASECQSHPVIRTESTSILVREFERMRDAKVRHSTAGKRQIEQSHRLERQSKHPRRQCLFEGNYRDLQEGSYTELNLSSA
ncbi:g1135 [Coccomyxa viridis]|uniref:G1135 protein n=1 Tax=Coccomyxa viridis TaxID=1274662 RepID=A0ABP1FHB2_9CHLO